jgi:O-antigen ligase
MIQLFAVAVLVADVVVHRPTVVRPLLWVYSLSAALTALVGAQALLTGGIASGERIAAFQGQDVAQFAAVLLPALVFSLFELLKGRLVLLSGAVALACTAGVVLSGTRGAWLSLVVVAVLFILPRFRPRQQVAAVAVALMLIAVTLQLPGTAELVAERTDVAISSGGSGRTDIWSVGISIFHSAPVAGVGFANFPIAFTSEQLRAAAVSSEIGTGRGPHSIIVGTLGELGLIGLALLALFVLPLVLRRGWGPEAPAVQAVLASLMTAALFLDVISNRKQVWLVLGLAAGLGYLRSRNGASVALRRTSPAEPSVQPAPARPMIGTSLQPPSRALP